MAGEYCHCGKQVMCSIMLRGTKVILRDKRLDDAANDYAWRCDEELARLDAASPMRISFADYLVSYKEELQYQSYWQRRFAIESLDGKHIGNCMYYDINEQKKEAELGILIGDRAYWNQGYGADVVTTLVNHIFEDVGLERVYLSTLDWNIRAQKCFGKCGFVRCGNLTRGQNRLIVMEVRQSWWRGDASPSPPNEVEKGRE